MFDVLHIGHVNLLKFAKEQGDHLIVAIDSDRRVKELKGENRPINSEQNRKCILKSIRWVDEVVIFDSSEELQKYYTNYNADVIVKGSEYTEQQVRNSNNIPNNIKIVLFDYMIGYSTTEILKKIKSLSSIDKI